MTFETIEFSIEAGVARIALNRPDRLNAFNLRMQDELFDAFKRIEATDSGARAILLTANGRGFCSGVDLTDRKPLPAGEKHDLGAALEAKNPLFARLYHSPIPVVCAVNGVAAGMGVGLALACDIVLAAKSASFVLAFSRIGLMPDCGVSFFLPRLIGLARANGAALLGEKISAEQAQQWGMIWRVLDDAALAEEAATLARKLAAGPTQAYRLTAGTIKAGVEASLEQVLAREAEGQRALGFTGDYAEGVLAFLEKRGANFAGR
ncbi:MAG: enoyl-CoA hydratase/isomerase family protein [Proteobacteria bacterium]|nr:enoyl-CoA hydratase/isomerase family protein [Burkholderiales bacterium]